MVDEAQQARFRGDGGNTDEQRTAIENIGVMTPMTPIDSAIESFLFGPGSLLRRDTDYSSENDS